MADLNGWTDHVCATLGLDPLTGPERTLLLDLARDAAHGVARPAAPVTTYLLGLAVGRGAPLELTAAELAAMATSWSPAAE